VSDALDLVKLLVLIDRCAACHGTGKQGPKGECERCRGVGYRVNDYGQFQALIQRLGK